MEIIKNYVQKNKERFVNELIDLLKIPSVSADSAYSQDVLNTADKVKDFLEKACNLSKLHAFIFGFQFQEKSTENQINVKSFQRK